MLVSGVFLRRLKHCSCPDPLRVPNQAMTIAVSRISRLQQVPIVLPPSDNLQDYIACLTTQN